jgi:hypothetical protein
MKAIGTILLACVAILAAFWVGQIVFGLVIGVLHWAFVLAIVGGIGYVCYSLASPRKSLGWKSKILP